MGGDAIEVFLAHFEGVDDPRIENANWRHDLGDMLVFPKMAPIAFWSTPRVNA